MDRDYIMHKCSHCGYEIEERFYASGYGDWRCDIDFQAKNAEHEKKVRKAICPVCKTGRVDRNDCLPHFDNLEKKMAPEDYLPLLKQGAQAWN